jgi:hypothetical protein
MAAPIELSEPQRSVLEAIANHSRYSRTLRSRAQAILAAGDGLDAIRISQRVRLDIASVRSVLAAWEELAEEIATTERFGRDLLRRKIEMTLTEVDQADGGGCCGGDDADDTALAGLSDLSPEDIRQLAQRVYDLLRHELRIERERLHN